MRPLLVLALAGGVAACAGPPGKRHSAGPGGSMVADGEPMLTAGARCQGAGCSCRTVDQLGRGAAESEGAIPAGHKRFELRTGRGFDPVSITVERRGTAKKPAGQVEPSCAYIDLPPGLHRVRLRMDAHKVEDGISPRLIINEYGSETHDWYATFQFACGSTGACTKDDMKAWFEGEARRDRGIFDPCGSVRVEGLRWDVEHSPDQRLEDLILELTLHVYKFSPRFPHGTAHCKGLLGGKGAERETAGMPDGQP